MFYFFLKFFIFPVIRLVWVKRVDGLSNIPKHNGVIVASNHESYFDFICFSAVCPRRIYYLAGEVFFKKWWWRPLVVFTGQIRVDRNQKDKSSVISQAVKALKQGKVVGIFPEGTRSADGKLQKAYTGIAKIALKSQVLVVPVGMVGTFEIMSRHKKIPRFKRCDIVIGQPINLSNYYDKKEDQNLLREITDNIIMKNIAHLTKEKYNFNL